MHCIKFIFLSCALLFITISNAQKYKFISDGQHLLTDEQIKTMQIIITPEVLLFNEQGKILPISHMELMANPDYRPLFYADVNGKIKSLVFQKKK